MKMAVWLAIALIVLIVLFRDKFVSNWREMRTHFRSWLYRKWKNWGEPFLVAAILAVLIRTFLVSPYKIPTGSMKPTFLEGDRIFVDKISYRFHPPKRGDIIVFKYPVDPKKDFVKRLAGLPGETLTIQDGIVSVNGKPLEEKPFSDHYYYNRPDWLYGDEGTEIRVPSDAYFTLGDNSGFSSDSRNWGFVPAENLVGKAVVIWWPPQRIKLAK